MPTQKPICLAGARLKSMARYSRPRLKVKMCAARMANAPRIAYLMRHRWPWTALTRVASRLVRHMIIIARLTVRRANPTEDRTNPPTTCGDAGETNTEG